jgi:hypothetical protein
MARAPISKHGRDHRPGGHDPIPALDDAIYYDVLNVGSGLRIETSAALTPLVVSAGIELRAGTPDGSAADFILGADTNGHPQMIVGDLHICEIVLDPGLAGSFYAIADGSAGPNMLRVNVDGTIYMPLLPTSDPGTGLGGLWVDGSNFVRYST